jgi:hypothetical protein
MAHIICNRRRFLGGLAAGLMATPFLPRFAGAGADPIPKRIVFVFTPNGTVKDNWLQWNAQPGQLTEHAIDEVPFSTILQPLEEYRQSMLVMRGINMEAAYDGPIPKDHWPDYMNQLTGRQPKLVGDQEGSIAGISIDQVIGDAWAEQDGASPIHSVQLGMHVDPYGGNRVVSARGEDQPLRPNDDPYDVFQTMFAGLDLDAAEATALRAKRGRVLDAVTAELRSAECQLAGEDRIKLQQHLEALVQLEDSLDADVGACTPPAIDDIDHQDDHNLRSVIDQQFLNLKTMLSCGLTRVATVMMGDGKTTHHELMHPEEHHYYSHSHDGLSQSDAAQKLTAIDGWYAARLKGFLDQLRATPEADGTLLDHTLVVWCHEQSTGAHLRRDMPYVFVGGSQIPIEMGRVIHAGGDYDHRDVTVNDLWTTVANRMGVGLTTFGDPAHFNGALSFL